jgi:rare lipoprotein A
VAGALCAVLLVVPLVALHGGGDASATSDRTVAAGGPPSTSPRTPRAHRPTPVAIAEAPVRQVTATTLAPATTTSTEPPTTTTTTIPTTTTTTTTAPAARAEVTGAVQTTGSVTYYDHPAGRCASPWLPFGTVVQVTNPANGATVTCTVDDREADTARSIDLATATFAELAPLSQGVIDARLSW